MTFTQKCPEVPQIEAFLKELGELKFKIYKKASFWGTSGHFGVKVIL